MNEFIKMVLNELRQGIVQGISVAIIAGAVIACAYAKHKEKYNGEKPFPWRKTILIFLLAGYLAVLGYATLSRLGGMTVRAVFTKGLLCLSAMTTRICEFEVH